MLFWFVDYVLMVFWVCGLCICGIWGFGFVYVWYGGFVVYVFMVFLVCDLCIYGIWGFVCVYLWCFWFAVCVFMVFGVLGLCIYGVFGFVVCVFLALHQSVVCGAYKCIHHRLGH